ncbi:MAG TPA: hypothetical protein VGH45_01090 [Solirubrobacteraceae bacterium]
MTDGPYAESQEVLAREPAVAVRGDTGKPAGWLITVAGRRVVDLLRSEQAPELGWRMIGSARVRRRSACHHA